MRHFRDEREILLQLYSKEMYVRDVHLFLGLCGGSRLREALSMQNVRSSNGYLLLNCLYDSYVQISTLHSPPNQHNFTVKTT